MDAYSKVGSEPTNNKWKGYTIDELEQRRVINRVKTELIMEQLKMSVPKSTSGSMGEKFMGQFSMAMSVSTYAMQLYRSIMGLMSLYRGFKGHHSGDGQ